MQIKIILAYKINCHAIKNYLPLEEEKYSVD
jgi:hypothetical protein